MYADLLSITIRIMELISVPKTNPSPCLSAFAIANSASIPRENSGGKRERESGGSGLCMTLYFSSIVFVDYFDRIKVLKTRRITCIF
jgi:hypothetical protein